MILSVDQYRALCQQQGVTHFHCPDGCEHPQPFMDDEGDYLCGRCFFVYGRMTPMVPCTPDICDES